MSDKTIVDKEYGLTRKKKNFADYLIKHPEASQAEAVRATYNVTNSKTPSALGSKLANDPAVLAYMEKHSETAEKVIIKVMKTATKNKDNVQWQRLALDSSNSILDRIHGKAISRTQNTNLNLTTEDILGQLT